MFNTHGLCSGRLQSTARPLRSPPALKAPTGQSKKRVVVIRKASTMQRDIQAGAPAVVSPREAFKSEQACLQSIVTRTIKSLSTEGDSSINNINKAALSAFCETSLLGLMKKHSTATQAACSPCQMSAAKRRASDAGNRIAYHIHAALNGSNTQSSLNWLNLPLNWALPLLETTYWRGLTHLDGSPVLRVQPQRPFRTTLAGYLALNSQRPAFVGRYEEVFGSDDMLVVPDAFAWAQQSELQSMLTDSVVQAYVASLPAGQQLFAATQQLGLHSSSTGGGEFGFSMRSLITWSGLLVFRFADAFQQQHIKSARSVVAAAAPAARKGVNADAALLTFSSGGSGGSSWLTAVGGGDEGELEYVRCSILPVRGEGDEEGSSSNSSSGHRCSDGDVAAGSSSSNKGWWARVTGAASRLMRCISSS